MIHIEMLTGEGRYDEAIEAARAREAAFARFELERLGSRP